MLSLFELASVLLLLCALFGFVNRAFLHLPNSVGMLLLGLLASIVLVGTGALFPRADLYQSVQQTLRQIDFTQVLFNGMLAFLLFAGALHVDFAVLRRRLVAVAYLAVVATIISTLLAGGLFWLAGQALGANVSLPWALVFGALISPTDPVGVLSLLKGVKLSDDLKVEAEGEALLNDGVGVVLFSHAENFVATIASAQLVDTLAPSHLFWIGAARAAVEADKAVPWSGAAAWGQWKRLAAPLRSRPRCCLQPRLSPSQLP